MIHGLVVVIKFVVLGGGKRVMSKRGGERVDLSHWRCEHRCDVGLRSKREEENIDLECHWLETVLIRFGRRLQMIMNRFTQGKTFRHIDDILISL